MLEREPSLTPPPIEKETGELSSPHKLNPDDILRELQARRQAVIQEERASATMEALEKGEGELKPGGIVFTKGEFIEKARKEMFYEQDPAFRFNVELANLSSDILATMYNNELFERGFFENIKKPEIAKKEITELLAKAREFESANDIKTELPEALENLLHWIENPKVTTAALRDTIIAYATAFLRSADIAIAKRTGQKQQEFKKIFNVTMPSD